MVREFVWLADKHLVVLDIVETPKPEKKTIAPMMRCHHPHVDVLTFSRLSFVTTNVSGLMIPAKPASIANDPPMINRIPAKLIQPTAAPLGSLETCAAVRVDSGT